MIIDETPLNGRITIETGAWGGSSYTWTDETSKVVSAQYEEGGRLSAPGFSMVDTGNLSIVYRDISTVPAIGSLIRIRRAGTSEYAFTGYIQDISTNVTYDFSQSTAPITFTRLYCLDWVGYASQFQLQGIGGKNSTGGDAPDYYHFITDRVAAFNRFIDSTGATLLVSLTGSVTGINVLGTTDRTGTLSNHLDLLSISTGTNWAATHALPTNPTTGRTGLVEVFTQTSSGSSGKTFTDGAGLAGELHYTEIDFEASSQNIANSIILNNHILHTPQDGIVTSIGGQDDKNYVEINGVKTYGVLVDIPWKDENPTSIATYGLRQSEVETCVGVGTAKLSATYQNLCSNPSAEYSGDGYIGETAIKVFRAKPSEEATPFTTKNDVGFWAIILQFLSNNAKVGVMYEGNSSDGISVYDLEDYVFTLSASKGISSLTDLRVRTKIQWFDSAGNQIGSNVLGTQVSLTATNTWYDCTSGVVTAPSGASRVKVGAEFVRSGGANIGSGTRLWVDNYHLWYKRFVTGGSTAPTYFDGDTPSDATYLYFWTGSPGASPSYRETNRVDTRAAAILADYASTSNRVTRIRWNAQENLSAVSSLAVGKSVVVKYNGTTDTYRIIGISGSLDYSRYVIDYYLKKI